MTQFRGASSSCTWQEFYGFTPLSLLFHLFKTSTNSKSGCPTSHLTCNRRFPDNLTLINHTSAHIRGSLIPPGTFNCRKWRQKIAQITAPSRSHGIDSVEFISNNANLQCYPAASLPVGKLVPRINQAEPELEEKENNGTNNGGGSQQVMRFMDY